MLENMFSQIDFGPLTEYLVNDDITDISYSNSGQVWIKTLSKGIFRIEVSGVDNVFMEKLAFQCSNVMGKSFNMAHPFLDAESAELRLNFIHDSIAKNGIAVVLRKTPAKIRLNKEKIIAEKYITEDIHEFLIQCVLGHCNIIVCGETGSGKTEFVKYLASKTREAEKIITIEDTLELHLDKIFPHRDIVAMKTNNIASYSEVLVTCMRQNPKWILLSEVRSAEAVMAVRNSISSGHYILSTIHADKALSIPNRMYSLLETNQDIEQFLASIHRYIQLGVMVRGYQDKVTKRFVREIAEVTEFYVDANNKAMTNVIYKKDIEGRVSRNQPTKYLVDYLEGQGIILDKNIINDEVNKMNSFQSVNSNITPRYNPITINNLQSSSDGIPIVASDNMAMNGNIYNNVSNSNQVNNNQVNSNEYLTNNLYGNSDIIMHDKLENLEE
ncbi:MAG: ATPase, T2SS/T4P/T4SS family [Bacilli bacterium]